MTTDLLKNVVARMQRTGQTSARIACAEGIVEIEFIPASKVRELPNQSAIRNPKSKIV